MPPSLIKQTRLKRGQTLLEVAQAVGSNAGHISKIENNINKPSPELAEKLAKHFGYAITEIQILYPERFLDN